MPANRPNIRNLKEDKQFLPISMFPRLITKPHIFMQAKLASTLKTTVPFPNAPHKKPFKLIKPDPKLNLNR